MKLFSFLIFSSLISFMSNLDASLCSPDYLNGDVNPYICSRLPTASQDNECCMIYFTGDDEASYRVCFEMTARMINDILKCSLLILINTNNNTK